MNGRRVAVFGLGRSGLGVARAALERGAQVVVYDEKPAAEISKPELLEEAESAGIELALHAPSPLPAEAYERHDLLVVNPAVSRTHPSLSAAVRSGLEVIGEIEFAYRIGNAPIIAITGTNGKSTSTVMTWLILKEAGYDAVLCGNIYGSGYRETTLTEAASASHPAQVLVAEVSSFQLEWVSEFRPACAGITNIAPDHLDRYDGSFEEYAKTKMRIFAAQTMDDVAVIRANDPVVKAPAAPRLKTFGSAGEHAFSVGSFLTIGDEEIDVRSLPFGGAHNYLNAMLAGLLAQSFHDRVLRGEFNGIIPPPEARDMAARGLERFKGLSHRMEHVGVSVDGVTFINNSMCTNPDAVISSCIGMSQRLHILMGGTNKGLDFAPLRVLFTDRRNKAYLFGRDAASMARQIGGGPAICKTMEEAFSAAVRAARSGEVVILAPGCMSTDQFKDFSHRGDVFKSIAKEWLHQCLEH